MPSKDRPHSSKITLKTVVITGGATGIGFETARQLLETGLYRLILVGRDRAKLEEAQSQLDAPLDQLSIAVCDLADSAQVKKTAEKIATTSKSIYGIINNAGVYPFGGALTTTEESWDQAFDVNLKAPFLLIQGLVKAMAKGGHGGRVINVSSTAGILPNHFALAYSVSKAALVQMTRTLAKELGKDNITINCVCPGIVRTPMHEAYHHNQSELDEFYERRGSAFPLGRVGEPKDVAGAIKFFLSEEAAWITGDILVVDGGRLLL